jgi:hypothetical protein
MECKRILFVQFTASSLCVALRVALRRFVASLFITGFFIAIPSFIAIFISIHSAQAQDKEEILADFSDIKEIERNTGFVQGPTRAKEWFEPDSNIGRLFTGHRRETLITTWLGMGSSDYRLEKNTPLDFSTHTGVRAEYRSKRKDTPPIILTCLVPHPRSLTARTLGLVKEFNVLERPIIESPRKRAVEVSGFSGSLLVDSEQERCEVLLALKRASLFHLESTSCESVDEFLHFAESLDIARLDTKLAR